MTVFIVVSAWQVEPFGLGYIYTHGIAVYCYLNYEKLNSTVTYTSCKQTPHIIPHLQVDKQMALSLSIVIYCCTNTVTVEWS